LKLVGELKYKICRDDTFKTSIEKKRDRFVYVVFKSYSYTLHYMISWMSPWPASFRLHQKVTTWPDECAITSSLPSARARERAKERERGRERERGI